MPDPPETGLRLFLKEMTKETSGNLTTEAFLLFLLVGLLKCARMAWKASAKSPRWYIPLRAVAILLIGVWVCGPLPLAVYIVSRNITVLRDLVDPVVAYAPESARRALAILSTP